MRPRVGHPGLLLGSAEGGFFKKAFTPFFLTPFPGPSDPPWVTSDPGWWVSAGRAPTRFLASPGLRKTPDTTPAPDTGLSRHGHTGCGYSVLGQRLAWVRNLASGWSPPQPLSAPGPQLERFKTFINLPDDQQDDEFLQYERERGQPRLGGRSLAPSQFQFAWVLQIATGRRFPRHSSSSAQRLRTTPPNQ